MGNSNPVTLTVESESHVDPVNYTWVILVATGITSVVALYFFIRKK